MIHAGIIAAGLGERLQGAGVAKPLVPVAGRPLVHWTVEALARAGVGAVTILLNSRGQEVRRSLESAFPRLAWRFLEWDSPSSWESFRRVSTDLACETDRFLISTVDALLRPSDVAAFARRALAPPEGESFRTDATLAVTSFVEDEKPLWVDLGVDGRVTAVGADARQHRWVTCGLYGMSRAAAEGLSGRTHERLRDYWTALAREGARVTAVTFEKTVDVDRPEDVASAETFLRETTCP